MEQNSSNVKNEYLRSQYRPDLVDENGEFDDITFTAITDGLGFHHGDSDPSNARKDRNYQRKKAQVASKVQTLKNTIKNEPKKISKENSMNHETNHYMGGLEAFYKEDKQEDTVKNVSAPKIKKKLKKAGVVERTLSYIADLALIIAFLCITFGIILVASGVEINLISNLLTKDELITYSSIIFTLNYLLYFTLLDVKATPGKLLFGIEMYAGKKKKNNAFKAFFRALISLTVVGMVFGIHDTLISTKVIKSNNA